MQWMAVVRDTLLRVCLIALFSSLPFVSDASAEETSRNLVYYAECVGGNCNFFRGGEPYPWGYRSPDFSTEAEARARAIDDYLRINGWEDPEGFGSPWVRKYSEAELSEAPVAYYSFPQQWNGRITFHHQSTLYRPDGLSPPYPPTPFEQSVNIRGVCKPGYVVKDYDTGECWRVPNACPGYPENSSFGCGESIADLEASSKPSTDPRHLFHAQQTCIAKKSCELRCQMDNCQWMDKVIPAFTNPYLNSSGYWTAVETDCAGVKVALAGMASGKWIADRACFAAMGMYHVRVDLRNALEEFGCGSQQDWDTVGNQIVPCLQETQPNYPLPYYRLGGIFVHMERTKVRDQCLAKRTSQGVPTDINTNLRGKVCEVAP